MKSQLASCAPGKQLAIKISQRPARIHHQDHAAQTLAFSKIMLDQDLPGGLHACRNTGKTVARQVGQAAVAVLKEVDRLRAPGGLAGAGEIPALTNEIGSAHV